MLGGSNPGPRFFYVDNNGAVTDLFALAFQVFDVSTDAKRQSPVQVYPVTPGDRATVAIGTALPAGDREGKGRYVARWTVPPAEPLGAHELRWFWQGKSGEAEKTAAVPFDVLAFTPPHLGALYALPSDFRAEGFPATGPAAVSDLRLLTAIAVASRYVEKVTRRTFGASYQEQAFDGTHTGGLLLSTNTPIVGAEEINFRDSFFTFDELIGQRASYLVYNRHLRGLLEPDDRADPKIELYDLSTFGKALYMLGHRFPRGRQNIMVKGFFGYTEPDGTPFGGIPPLLREAVKMIAPKGFGSIASGARNADRLASAIKSESTREQKVDYGFDPNNRAFIGAITGDPYVDQLLLTLRAPMRLGAV